MKGQTKLQKKKLLTDLSHTKIPYTNLKSTINEIIHETTKYTTKSTIFNIPLMGGWQVTEANGKEEAIVSRLRISHTHTHLLTPPKKVRYPNISNM